MESTTKSKGGRKIDHNPFYFIVSAHQDPDWFLVQTRFGHTGIVLLLAISQNMCRSKHFLLKMDAKFYSTLARDYNINKDQCAEILAYLTTETEIYDNYLFRKSYLFSVEFLRGFHRAKYFRDRKHSAQDILDAINKIREDQTPLALEDDLEKLMSIRDIDNCENE